MTRTKAILSKILEEAKEKSQNKEFHFYVFDIDSTLLDVSPRIQKILEAFAQDPDLHAEYPEIAKKFQQVKVERNDWGIRQAFERLKIPTVPQKLKDKAKSYWQEHFFSNLFLHHDLPYEGATEFVNQLYNLGHHVVYLTGRDVHRMGTGTEASLKQLGFPVATEKSQLVLKPDKTLIDTEFKKAWFENKIQQHPQLQFVFFENEPVNINAVRHLHPKLQIIFFESNHSGKAPSPEDLPKISHFKLGSY